MWTQSQDQIHIHGEDCEPQYSHPDRYRPRKHDVKFGVQINGTCHTLHAVGDVASHSLRLQLLFDKIYFTHDTLSSPLLPSLPVPVSSAPLPSPSISCSVPPDHVPRQRKAAARRVAGHATAHSWCRESRLELLPCLHLHLPPLPPPPCLDNRQPLSIASSVMQCPLPSVHIG